MGQKKRASAARHVPPSNSSPPPVAVGFEASAGSPPPADGEQWQAASRLACNVGGCVMNGGLVANGGGGLDSWKGRGEELTVVKGDCEKALVALRRGNSTKALKLIRDACNRYEGSALVQRIRGHICMRLASIIEDAITKERHLKEAIEAAQKAVILSPHSIEYAQFHAQLLFEAATDSKGYEEVEQECQRALSILDPIDPAKESLYEESQHKLPTPEARIAQVQQELRSLVQKANIASISNWMKTLGNGGSEEKLRFIHMRKLEEPLEQRVSQPKRPHEVKKSVKTPDEIRKDIEVRVAAARLLQQRRECSPPHSDDGVAVAAKGGSRLERRKSSGSGARKLGQSQNVEERIDRLKPFWSGIDAKEREKMLEVPLDALKNHLGSSKTSLAASLLTEALEFAQENKTWRFWICCSCGDKFIDCQEHAQHVMHKHIDSLPQKLRRLLPSEIDHDMADQIMDEDCRPFDGPAAIKLLIKSSHVEIEEESGSFVNGEGTADLIAENVSITAPNEETGQDPELDKVHVCDGKCHRSKTVQRLVREMPTYELPYADDTERTKLLQKIYNLFRILLRNKCLASDHMEKIVQYAVDELQSFVPDTSVQYEFNHSPLYVRFLPAPQLHRIFRYLRELVNACGLDQLSDSRLSTGLQNEDDDVIPDRLFLNEDFTMLALDERLLKDTFKKPAEISGGSINDVSIKQQNVANETDSLNCQPLPLMIVKDGENISHRDLQLVWIYGVADYEHQPLSWKQLREARVQQSRDVLTALEKEILTLQSLCERKREHLHHEMAVSMAEALCVEELKKREQKGDGTFRSFEAVLKKRQQELLDSRSIDLSSQQKLELEVLTTILREAQTVTVPQFPYDGTISVSSSRLSDLDEEDEDAWRVQEFVPQTDSCIEVVIQRQKERSSSEVNKLDARILRVMDSVQRLERKLGNSSVLDYRAVVLPLVKSFLKARLEDAAEKDALEKSDAAREAFLAELSRDRKHATDRASDSGRQAKEKTKDKKKNRERRLKDGKRVPQAGLDKQSKSVMDGLPANDACEGLLEDEDGAEWDVVEERQEKEAVMRRQAELEAEERKLAETLELQRRVEEEAKEKHLAKMKKKQAETEAETTKTNFCLDKDNDLLETICQHAFPSVVTDAKVPHPSEEAPDTQFSVLASSSSLSSNTSGGNLQVGDNETVECMTSGSLQSMSVISLREEDQRALNKDMKGSFEQGLSRPGEKEPVTGVEKLVENLTISSLPYNNHDSLPKPRRSNKNRRKKSVRSLGDGKHSGATEEQIGGTQIAEHVKSENMSPNGSVEGNLMPREPASIQTHSLRSPSKEIMDKEGDALELCTQGARNPSKTLRQLKAEQDDEERFQADLEQAMRQSLANVTEATSDRSQMEYVSRESVVLPVPENLGSVPEDVGKGLQNENGQYNCFLNVVIQSLWHLRKFREEILAVSSAHHVHVGVPCVVCALRDIFVGLNAPVLESSKDAVAPTTLRVALSTLCSKKAFFQEAQMNDASEVLSVIFDCLHKAFTVATSASDSDITNGGIGFWECHECTPCIAHSLFGLDIAMQMNCTGCKRESRHLKYTSFFHNINASALRAAKMYNQGSSLDELLRYVDMNHRLPCDKDIGGCGKLNYIHYLLRAAPHVFITVLGWQTSRESLEDIIATVDALELDLDVGIVYRGLDEGFKHRLVSVICYYGQHYHCFAFNHEIGRWVMFDDTTVKVVGRWEDVLDTCHRGHLQPQVLFYEALVK